MTLEKDYEFWVNAICLMGSHKLRIPVTRQTPCLWNVSSRKHGEAISELFWAEVTKQAARYRRRYTLGNQ